MRLSRGRPATVSASAEIWIINWSCRLQVLVLITVHSLFSDPLNNCCEAARWKCWLDKITVPQEMESILTLSASDIFHLITLFTLIVIWSKCLHRRQEAHNSWHFLLKRICSHEIFTGENWMMDNDERSEQEDVEGNWEAASSIWHLKYFQWNNF